MPATSKDTIYLDVEDEITAVIEKVHTAKHKIVALVLPKHATVFQSSVNMKLLKKAATASKKNLVLITSDKAVLAIAGATKLHVAKTLSTKPEIPASITTPKDSDTDTITNTAEGSVAEKNDTDDNDDAIELDNTDPTDAPVDTESGIVTRKKRFKIPDFSSFSVRVGLGIALVILLFVLWLFGFVIMPRATITIETNTMTTSVNTQVTARVGSSVELDLEDNILPATRAQVEKVDTVRIPATGERNVGNEATGIMNLTNCIDDGEDKIIPAGTSFSAGSLTFVTTQAVTLDFAIYAGNNCVSSDFGRDKDVPVVATQPGPNYNVSAQSYASSISGIRAFGSDMSGGTTELITVVSEEDVETARQQLRGASRAQALVELQENLQSQELRPINETLREGEPTFDVTPAVNAEASELEVRMTLSYSLLGLSEEDIEQMLENEVIQKLEDDTQNIRNSGIDGVVFTLVDTPNEADTRLTVETIALIGPEIDVDALKEEVVGMKRGDIERRIRSIDGVQSVIVEYSPAWITTTPKSANKIDILFNEEDSN